MIKNTQTTKQDKNGKRFMKSCQFRENVYRKLRFLCTALLVLGSLVCTNFAAWGQTVVTFPDANLEAAIREAINKPTGDIYDTDLVGLTFLNAENKGISNLTGLEHCTGLTALYLKGNQISDLSPLANCTSLMGLYLNENQVSDLSPLAGLTNLMVLQIGHNQIGDISPLAALTSMTRLGLFNNQISDLSPLTGMTNLRELRLDYNQISDLSPLAGLTSLTELDLPYNHVSDISPVAGLTNLTRLHLMANQISDVSPLAGLTNLTTLILSYNQIVDISPLAGLTNLTLLGIGSNQISDISPLATLTNLTILDLFINEITDLSPLAGLGSLEHLNVGKNYQLSDLSPLAGLTNLRELVVEWSQVSDISPLASLTNLTRLTMFSGNEQQVTGKVSDISPLIGLTNLTDLCLTGNQITDIGPLVANTGFGTGDRIFLERNRLDLSEGTQASQDVQTLIDRGVTVYLYPQCYPPNPPIADAGADQIAPVGGNVLRIGTATDSDCDPITTWLWEVQSRPAGSIAEFSDPSASVTVFVPDVAGEYIISLIACDDSDGCSEPDTAVITAILLVPEADAGPDQSAYIGDTVFLTGAAADPNGDPITTWLWEFQSKPAGSVATFADPSVSNTSFVPDMAGEYIVSLVACDDSDGCSAPDTAVITALDPRSGSGWINPDGGTVSSLDGSVMMTVPPLAADEDVFISISDSGNGTVFELTTNEGVGTAYYMVTIEPEGLVFNLPVTISLSWPDVDDNGVIDGTNIREENLMVVKDGEPITQKCQLDPANCDGTANVFAVQVISLSDFALFEPSRRPTALLGCQLQRTVSFNATHSSDPEGGALSYEWDFGDGSALSYLVSPTHHYSSSGEYLVSLTVTDDQGQFDTDFLVITVVEPPVANAGPDQSVHQGNMVTLDGSGSSDPDGDYPLNYAWELITKPQGSGAALSNPASVNPTFTADLNGDYLLQLVVTDSGESNSTPDFVLISAFNMAPVADAGEDQALLELHTVVQLGADPGRQSYDEDGDTITYLWSIIQKPADSLTTLDEPTSATPTFEADVYGDYVVSLVVTDCFGTAGDPDEMTVSFENITPVADAGGNQAVVQGDTVYVDGSGSYDPNPGDQLTYSWSFVSRPEGSVAEFSDPTLVQPNFVADQAGTFIVSLVVNDGLVDSDPDYVTIEVISTVDAMGQTLLDLIDAINNLDLGSLKNKNMKNSLTNKINAVLSKIENGFYEEALDKMENDILGKTNGCAEIGEPDMNDWIITCEAQGQVYPLVITAIDLLGNLIE